VGSNRVRDNYLGKKVNIFTGLICILAIVTCIYSLLFLKEDVKKEDKSNLLRIETSNQRELIKEMFKKNNYYMGKDFFDYGGYLFFYK